MNVERWLLALTPAVAVATVALGLRVGAPSKVRAAIVYATSKPLTAGTRAFSIFVFREDDGAREPVVGLPLRVQARTADDGARWKGITNEDGVAECVVPVGLPATVMELWVSGGDEILAHGAPVERPPTDTTRPPSPWMASVRREGEIAIDAVLVGERAAPRFPATIWVHAQDRATGRPIDHARVELEGDESLTPHLATATTVRQGWASIVTTPLGLAVTVTLRARGRLDSGDGPEVLGEWVGPFPMAPGAARVDTPARWSPGEEIEIDLTEPTPWRAAYLEIDDARGCAWAGTASGGVPRPDGGLILGLHVPPLPPGLYWAVASAAPFASTEGETRIAYRAFFVAPSDDAALALGTDAQACAPPSDPRDAVRALGPCLALSARRPIERWVALDGFVEPRSRDRQARATGLHIALVGLLVAALLEGALLLRGAARARVRLREETSDERAPPGLAASRAWTVMVTVLVALLGFALLAAFLFRVS